MTAFVLAGDCLESMRRMPDACIDAVVTDPPYGLSKEPNMFEVLAAWMAQEDYAHRGGGFMGKTWDSFVPGPSVWREVLRLLKPGGHALVFSGTRTYDLTVVAMRLAGFEIRDQLAWMTGTGFPKSLDFAADQAESQRQGRRVPRAEFVGHPQEEGWGTALKPAQEPICLARKPLIGTVAANVLAHGTGGINVDACRIGSESTRRTNTAANSYMSGEIGQDQKTGDSYRTGSDAGRWPANVLLDEEAAAALDEQSGVSKSPQGLITQGGDHFSIGSEQRTRGTKFQGHGDSGGASRFFYVAKTSKTEREAGLEGFASAVINEATPPGSTGSNSPRAGAGRNAARKNIHPTVKPIALMRHLVKLVTPPGGIVLDPYTGSGSTGCAAVLEGFRFVGCELCDGTNDLPDYVTIARARIAHAQAQVDPC